MFVGIATFWDFIESSSNRITCEFSGEWHIGTCWWRSWIRQTMCGVETGVAFAGEKWLFFVRFSVAEVLSVLSVAVEG